MKIIKYLFIKITIDIVTLMKIFYNKITYYHNMLNDIVNDRGFIFINNFQLIIYFHFEIK